MSVHLYNKLLVSTLEVCREVLFTMMFVCLKFSALLLIFSVILSSFPQYIRDPTYVHVCISSDHGVIYSQIAMSCYGELFTIDSCNCVSTTHLSSLFDPPTYLKPTCTVHTSTPTTSCMIYCACS